MIKEKDGVVSGHIDTRHQEVARLKAVRQEREASERLTPNT